jgi:hypothetical protein
MNAVKDEIFDLVCIGGKLSLHCFATVLYTFICLVDFAVYLRIIEICLGQIRFKICARSFKPSFLYFCLKSCGF